LTKSKSNNVQETEPKEVSENITPLSSEEVEDEKRLYSNKKRQS